VFVKYVYIFHNKTHFQRWGLSWHPCRALWFLCVCCDPLFCDFMLMINGIAHCLCLLMEQTNYFSFDKCNSSFNSRNFCFLTTSWSPTPLVVLLTTVTSIVGEWLLYLFLDKYSDVFSWLTLDTLAYFLTANIYKYNTVYVYVYFYIWLYSCMIIVWSFISGMPYMN